MSSGQSYFLLHIKADQTRNPFGVPSNGPSNGTSNSTSNGNSNGPFGGSFGGPIGVPFNGPIGVPFGGPIGGPFWWPGIEIIPALFARFQIHSPVLKFFLHSLHESTFKDWS